MIKSEVNQVVRVINYETNKYFRHGKDNVRQRVLEAYSIAENIYSKYRGKKTDDEIKQIIIDALRPIRFANGQGYYFINGYDGVPSLLADRPEQEGKSLLNRRDTRGQYVFRDLIALVKSKGEGFYSYHWTKPGQEGDDFEKISYVKLFEPFDWFIGTGIYLDDIEKEMQRIIAHYVTTHRFGLDDQGYVFINELIDIQGGKKFARVYANPNRPNDSGKFLSDDFRDAKGKMFRKEFLKGLGDKGECYVEYWYKKIGTDLPSPKISFFKLAGNSRFIVAAGVYSDDIEKQILILQNRLRKQLQQSLVIICLLFVVAISVILLFFNRLNKKIERDFHLFVEFFKGAAISSDTIDRKKVKFAELDQLAAYANQMLAEKNKVKNELQSIFRVAPTGIGVVKDRVFYQVNKKLCEMTGYTEKELLGQSSRILYRNDDDFRYVGEEKYQQISEKETGTVETKFKRKDGTVRDILLSSTPLDISDLSLGVSFTALDITEKLKAEKVKKDLENQLIQVQKLESLGRLAGGIAHDLNNMLSPILGYCEMLMADIGKNADYQKKLQSIHKAGMGARTLVGQLLAFSRKQTLKFEKVDVDDVILGFEKLLQRTIREDINLRIVTSAEAKTVMADIGQLEQIIMNLCVNAADAMPNGGNLTIETAFAQLDERYASTHQGVVPGDYVLISFTDTGHGMDDITSKNVFEPFFTTKGDHGTGLGLATVYGIVKQHKGNIWVYSEVDKGTVFKVYLPFERGEAKKSETSPKSDVNVKGTETILLAEDQEGVRHFATDILKSNGYTVITAVNGKEALEIWASGNHSINLLITDVIMPEMNGKELYDTMKSIDPEIKVLYMSGYMDNVLAPHGVMDKGTDYIPKPFNVKDFLIKVRQVIEKSKRGE